MYDLTVIVPIYNEESLIQDSFQRLYDSNVAEYIFLVDDSSIDSSKTIAQKNADRYSNVKLFSTPSNQGKGAALSFVKEFVETSHVAIHDADLEYDPKDLITLRNISIKEKDSLVLGSRFIGNLERNNVYKSAFFANKFLSIFFSIINNYKVTDVATCYKIFPTDFFKNTKFYERGFSIEIELLTKFLKHNKSIIEVPITYFGRSISEGKKINIIDGFYYIFNILKYRIF